MRQVSTTEPRMPGFGTERRWSREIGGQLFSFTVVNMPDGEIRWFVSRFNGYVGGPRWGCAWDRHREWTFRAPKGIEREATQ